MLAEQRLTKPRGPAWTEADDRLLRQWRSERVTIDEIARRLGRKRAQVDYRIAKLRLCARKAPDWTYADEEQLGELLEAHKSYEQIASLLNRSVKAVRARCAHLGISATSAGGRTVRRTAGMLGVEDKTVSYWCNQGWLRAHYVGLWMGKGPVRVVEHEELLLFLEDERYWHLWEPARITDVGIREWTEELRAGVRYFTTGQVAERLFITHYRVNQLIRQGRLKAVKHGSNWLVKESDVQYPEWLPRHRGKAATTKQKRYVQRHWNQLTAVEIARRLGRSDSWVHYVARQFGLPRLGRGKYKQAGGEKCDRAVNVAADRS